LSYSSFENIKDEERKKKMGKANWNIGFMAWRIGDILELYDQIEWIHNAGFDAIGIHSSPGIPNNWQGVDPSVTNGDERRRLRQKLETFRMCEIHAPFDLVLRADILESVRRDSQRTNTEKLSEHIILAGDIGASVLTVHADISAYLPEAMKEWEEQLSRLDAQARKAGIVVGLEITKGFEFIREFRGDNIGITLDIGHIYLNDGEGYLPYRTVSALINILDNKLLHIHIHDYNGVNDHIEIGTGHVNFGELFHALIMLDFKGALCLELNPDLVSPDGIIRSLEYLRTLIGMNIADK